MHRTEVVELGGQNGRGGRVGLNGYGVGPQVETFDYAVRGGEVGVVVELQEG